MARTVETAWHEHGPACGHTGAEDTGPEEQRRLLEAAKAGPSSPLPGPLLSEARSFYKNDKLSVTRIHDDLTAQRAATALGVEALTVGADVFLGPTARGRKDIIGHELSHVAANLQGHREPGNDNGAGVSVTDSRQASERTATTDGAAFEAGETTAPSVVSPSGPPGERKKPRHCPGSSARHRGRGRHHEGSPDLRRLERTSLDRDVMAGPTPCNLRPCGPAPTVNRLALAPLSQVLAHPDQATADR
ncbi:MULTISPECIES: eCIS core domain-containing protein [unclassified Streptomyces]|uniref:eCIS core domain-containing protein n=1 Tax=unclassified Streptomyces TaxID=2593676 RepID=UPI003D93C5F2